MADGAVGGKFYMIQCSRNVCFKKSNGGGGGYKKYNPHTHVFI